MLDSWNRNKLDLYGNNMPNKKTGTHLINHNSRLKQAGVWLNLFTMNWHINQCIVFSVHVSVWTKKKAVSVNRIIWWCVRFIDLSFVSVHTKVIKACINFFM